MQGEKLEVAKRAALAVLDRLDERDEAAVTIFDREVQVLQERATVTRAVREQVRAALAQVQARGNTALHEGWLTGCRALAVGDAAPAGRVLSRCFLLTDGLANNGVTDPEQIATEAAGVRQNAGIATSTFGIGPDYDENLLGPMAVAGGGRFHHLRTAQEIASTFSGELAELFAVAARNVVLRIEVDQPASGEVVSAYWSEPKSQNGRMVEYDIALGDLMHGEERNVVVRFALPARSSEQARLVDGQPVQQIHSRLMWADDGSAGRCETGAPTIDFRYATDAECDAERHDPTVMHWVGLHHADRARRVAADQSRRGDLAGAGHTLRSVARRIGSYAGSDADLHAALAELRSVEEEVTAAPVAAMAAKELTAASYTRSRGQRDLR